VMFRTGRAMLLREADGTRFRLLGIGLSKLAAADACDPPNLLDRGAARRANVERAMDTVRGKFGDDAVRKGRSARS
jgi:DNA polymerase IV